MSILDGIEEVLDEYLGTNATHIKAGKCPYYRHKRVLVRFCEQRPNVRLCDLMKLFLDKFGDNCDGHRSNRSGQPSIKNWRDEPQLHIDPNNTDPEIILERQIVNDCDEWVNQVPTCASYCDANTDSRVCLDLTLRISGSKFRLVELKWESDTPLYAAIEILRYFGLYLYTRRYRSFLGEWTEDRPILDASDIELWVLAPHKYYQHKNDAYNLRWFQIAINEALDELLASGQSDWPSSVSFAFKQFPNGFDYRCKGDELERGLDGITSVYE